MTDRSGAILNECDSAEAEAEVSFASGLGEVDPKVLALLNLVSDFLFVVRRDGVIRGFQGSRHTEFAVPSELFLGKCLADLLPEDTLGLALERLEEAFRTGQPQSFDCHFPLPGGLSDFEVRLTVWEGDEVVAMVRDVTERRILQKELFEIRQRERTRIGQDIHDGLGQMLTGISFQSKALHNKLKARNVPEANEALEIGEQVLQTLSQTRNLARGLFGAEVEVDGLSAALRELASTAEERFDVSCTVECDPEIRIEGDYEATHLFRLTQEAVSNSVKHGKARKVKIVLRNADPAGDCVLSITDDGCGFSVPSAGAHGLGLRIMKYRAQKVGGHLEVGPGPEGGTEVRCAFRNQGR